MKIGEDFGSFVLGLRVARPIWLLTAAYNHACNDSNALVTDCGCGLNRKGYNSKYTRVLRVALTFTCPLNIEASKVATSQPNYSSLALSVSISNG